MLLKDIIKREYQKKGYSLYEFTKELGMTSSNFGNQLNREDKVQLGLLKKICVKLDIPLQSLLSENEPGEDSMIHEQLDVIIAEGDEQAVEIILGKISKEYMNTMRRKNSKKAGNGEREA
jgi:transcriptional regulator with XRE-family HTH domain